MLLNYQFKNVMSFKENVEFSLLAPKTKVKQRFPNNFVSSNNGDIDILKTAVIVGENAGGKSNFVKSLAYLQSFFKETDKAKAYKNMINNNNQKFCPKERDTLQSFDIEVLIEDSGIYQYCLEIDCFGVVKELLSFQTQYKGKRRLILSVERQKHSINCEDTREECSSKRQCHAEIASEYSLSIAGSNSEIRKSLYDVINKNKPLGLTVTKLALLGNEYAIHFTEWIKNYLCPETNIINYDIYKSMRNEEDDLRILHDPRYLDIFRMVDYSIAGFKLDEEKPFSKTLIIRKRKNGNTFSTELGRDSSGVREFFAWAVQIFKVVYENKTVFADEMDRVLNPVLSDRVISFICGKDHHGQFIFTTHNVLHLDLKNYMKEQIYFITKDGESLNSELYSLADFPEIRYETTKIYEFYMKGILGGTAIE